MTSRLSHADVARLMQDPTPEARVETAAKVAAEFGERRLNAAERNLAEEIFRVMVKDVEVRVREALSEHLKHCVDIPHDLALKLAEDVDSVALPMLRFSEALTDNDLIAIIQYHGAAKQIAVAQRASVSSKVAGALVGSKNEQAVETLVANDGARFEDALFERILVEYKGCDGVEDVLTRRADLPARIAEQMVSAVTRQLAEHFGERLDLSDASLSGVLVHARERATVGLISEGISDDELDLLAAQLHDSGRLTPSIVLRGLCMGDMRFFETAMARLAAIPVHNARVLLREKGTLGLESIYLRTGLPEQLFDPIRIGVELSNEMKYDGAFAEREQYTQRVLGQILRELNAAGGEVGRKDIEYLMSKLQQLAA